MVKNTKGGKKAKNIARKNIGIDKTLKYDDLVKTEDQEYARVLKINGGNRYDLLLLDNTNKLGISRGKINRTKVELGTIVLISKRDFQQDKCDILHIYNASEVQLLISKGDLSDSFAKLSESSSSNDMITFGTGTEEDNEVNFEDL